MRKHLQLKTWILLTLFIFEIFSPTHLLALSSGPSQPEMAAFTPAGTTEMVDPFTGDFTYNIPLMDIEGYPVNIAYNSGVTMEQEASWVGLGWNLNVGTINRSVRGLPDDFKGDSIETETSMKPMQITKVGLGKGIEIVGGETLLKLSASRGLSFIHNNYKGFGIAFDNSIGTSFPLGGSALKANAKVGLTLNSLDGTTINSSLGVSVGKNVGDNGSLSFGGNMGSGYNTRTGQTMLSFGTTAGYQGKGKVEKTNDDGSTSSVEKEYGLSSPSATSTYLPIGMNTYTPYPNVKLKTSTVSFAASVGSEAWTVHPNARLNGSRTVQELVAEKEYTKSFGFIYSELADFKSLKDFNRDKSVSLNKTTTNLSPVNFTYDVYSVSGQGVSGMFRPFRNDIGQLNDPFISYKSSESSSFGGDLGLGAYFHGGLSYDKVEVISKYGSWQSGNGSNELQFQANEVGSNFENVYFKAAGDKTEADINYFNSLGGFDAIAFKLNGHSASKSLIKESGGVLSSLPQRSFKDRSSRSKGFSILTAGEARFAALEKKIFSVKGQYYSTPTNQTTSINRVDNQVRKAHHISEITQVNANGERFVFGIPAYNISKKEVTYRTSQKFPTVGEKRISYNSGEASTGNSAGIDGYYSSTETPPYAHSFLLTGRLSSDYQDVTGNGISSDDIGTAHKFNYQRTSDEYKWRTPYSGVSFMEGFKSNEFDQKGSYSYGTKELWYVNSIESKNQVAEFYISPRKDALGVSGEGGGKSSGTIDAENKTYRLDSIVLFNKYERISKGIEAAPIKKVAFTYDYSLCIGVENQIHPNDSGKLTLKKIVITYGKSNIGKQSPYVFNYSNINPRYNADFVDRWGNYKPSTLNPGPMSNSDFPYTVQNHNDSLNKYSSAWSLSEILTPYGGVINVEYESDDYGYVQNKDAMQMYPILGAGDSETYDSTLSLHTLYDNDYLYFKRPKNVPSDIQEKELKKWFFGKDGKMDNMYFRFLTSIGSGKNEYVSGYTSPIEIGYCDNTTAYLYLRIKDENPNAISKTAWGYFRQNLFEVLYQQPNIRDTGLESILKGIAANIAEITQMVTSVESHLEGRNIANLFEKERSFIRLNSAEKFKKGGGSRVKRITMNDSWRNMSREGQNASYGQEYEYTTLNENGREISSGVASYEPMIGNDENPFRQPIPYTAVAAQGHIPAIEAYQETPFGESFFPSANVGYSEVKVKNINYSVGKTAKTETEHKFYTAKDFPVIVKDVDIEAHDDPTSKVGFTYPFSDFTNESKYTASQGYTIILNDMHGKAKSTINYGVDQINEGGYKSLVRKKIGGTIYNYQTIETPKGGMLDNKVDVLTSEGYIESKLLGVEFDLAIDSRRSYESTSSESNQLNADVIPGLFAGVPFPIPTGFYNRLTDIKVAKSISLTKVIQTYGLVESVETFTDQYSTTAYNRVYNGLTGEVLLTETIDEHLRNEFQYTIPATMVEGQQRMGPSYQNVGYETAILPETDSICITSEGSYKNPGYLKHGDEVLIYPNQKKVFDENTDISGFSEKPYKAWVDLSGKRNKSKDPIELTDCLIEYDGFGNLVSGKGQIRLGTRLDFSFCNDSSYFYQDPPESEMNRNQTVIYHLNDSIADYINEWTEERRDSTYQGIFSDTSASSLCSKYGIDPQTSIVTVFGSSLSGYHNFSDVDTLSISSFFDLNDPVYSLGNSYYPASETVDCDASGLDSPYYEPDFYTPFERGVPSMDGFSTELSIPDSITPYEEIVSYTYILSKYNPSMNKYLKFNQLFLVHNIEYEEISAGNYSDSIIEESYSIRWISPCSHLPYLDKQVANNFEPIIPDSSYEVFEFLPNRTISCKASPFPSLEYEQSCPFTYRLMDRSGNYISNLNSSDTLKVIRSGNRNMLTSTSGNIVSTKNPISQDGTNKYLGLKTAEYGLKILQAQANTYSDTFNIDNPYIITYVDENDTFKVNNKFLLGQDATFRLDSNLRYVSSRFQKSSIETSKDGYMEVLPNLWELKDFPCEVRMSEPDFKPSDQSSSGWQLSEKIISYSPDGSPVESVNNLGIYSAARKSYNNSLELVSSNTKQKNVLYDNFENYNVLGSIGSFPQNYFRAREKSMNGPGFSYHFDETEYLLERSYVTTHNESGLIFEGIAHTGNYSMMVRTDILFHYMGFKFKETNITPLEHSELGTNITNHLISDTINYRTHKENNQDRFTENLPNDYPKTYVDDIEEYNDFDSTAFIETRPDYINVFNLNDTSLLNSPELDSGKYHFSIWSKEIISSSQGYAMEAIGDYGEQLKVLFVTGTDTTKMIPTAKAIDGWRKIEGTFDCDGSSKTKVLIYGGIWGAFFDDLRIQPYGSSVNTFVYDRYSGRLKAKLDENNYAVFYEYNDEGIPSQMKRETDDGVFTISESRQSKNHHAQ